MKVRDCIAGEYDGIKYRKGKMVYTIFIKEENNV